MDESKLEKPKREKEEEMKEEKKKEISAAEKGKLPTIFIIYRDNDLFKELIPKIAETLKGLGREVEIQNFPQNTDIDDIKEWLEHHQKEFKDKLFMVDETCGDALRHQDITEELRDERSDLDSLVNETVAETILGDEYKEILKDTLEEGKRSWAYAEKAMPIIVNSILKNKENVPDIVSIHDDNLLDHAPFSEFADDEDYDKAVEKVKEWLIKGGVSKDAIEGELEPEEKKPTTWTIFDRHANYSAGINDTEYYKDIGLRLPLSNFFSDAVENGLLVLEPKDLQRYEEVLKEKLEKFGNKSEEEK